MNWVPMPPRSASVMRAHRKGELEIHIDGCETPPIILPLAPAAMRAGVTILPAHRLPTLAGPARSLLAICSSAPRSLLGARLGRDWGVGRVLKIIAPFDGWCAPLDEVPDEVFAGRMLGDGLAIDPTSGILLAPCDGEIVTLPESAHAVSIRAAGRRGGADPHRDRTVRLAGMDLTRASKPAPGSKCGEELIRFDSGPRGARREESDDPDRGRPPTAQCEESAHLGRGQGGRVAVPRSTASADICEHAPKPPESRVGLEHARGAHRCGRSVAGLARPAGGVAGAARQRRGRLDHASSARPGKAMRAASSASWRSACAMEMSF